MPWYRSRQIAWDMMKMRKGNWGWRERSLPASEPGKPVSAYPLCGARICFRASQLYSPRNAPRYVVSFLALCYWFPVRRPWHGRMAWWCHLRRWGLRDIEKIYVSSHRSSDYITPCVQVKALLGWGAAKKIQAQGILGYRIMWYTSAFETEPGM
jgi:hypothetical protein